MDTDNNTEQVLTFGQKAVSSHPTQDLTILSMIDASREITAAGINLMKDIMEVEGRSERAALATIAYRKLQSAQMDMVKAITWKD